MIVRGVKFNEFVFFRFIVTLNIRSAKHQKLEMVTKIAQVFQNYSKNNQTRTKNKIEQIR